MKKMLIADDVIHLRKLVLTYAGMEEYQCQEAEDAQQALSLIENESLDMVFEQQRD